MDFAARVSVSRDVFGYVSRFYVGLLETRGFSNGVWRNRISCSVSEPIESILSRVNGASMPPSNLDTAGVSGAGDWETAKTTDA
jgi:hypothetical protein